MNLLLLLLLIYVDKTGYTVFHSQVIYNYKISNILFNVIYYLCFYKFRYNWIKLLLLFFKVCFSRNLIDYIISPILTYEVIYNISDQIIFYCNLQYFSVIVGEE